MTSKEMIGIYTVNIVDQNENKWKVIEVSDLDEILEAFANEKLKELNDKVAQLEAHIEMVGSSF